MKETAAMIMAGGRSARMRAAGSSCHKALRTVGGRPLIDWSIRALLDHGFGDLCVAVNATERALGEWVAGEGRPLVEGRGGTLRLLLETEPLGTIGAVSLLSHPVETLLVVNVDNLSSLDLGALERFHREEGAAATIASHREGFRLPFGMLELEGGQVRAYREKPELPVTISSGTYVLSSSALRLAAPGERLDLPVLMERLLREGQKVVAFSHQAPWIDINDEAALAKAERWVAGREWSR